MVEFLRCVSSICRERVSPSSLSEMNAILCPVGDQAGSMTASSAVKVERDRFVASIERISITSPVSICARTLSPCGDQSIVGSLPRLERLA